MRLPPAGFCEVSTTELRIGIILKDNRGRGIQFLRGVDLVGALGWLDGLPRLLSGFWIYVDN